MPTYNTLTVSGMNAAPHGLSRMMGRKASILWKERRCGCPVTGEQGYSEVKKFSLARTHLLRGVLLPATPLGLWLTPQQCSESSLCSLSFTATSEGKKVRPLESWVAFADYVLNMENWSIYHPIVHILFEGDPFKDSIDCDLCALDSPMSTPICVFLPCLNLMMVILNDDLKLYIWVGKPGMCCCFQCDC